MWHLGSRFRQGKWEEPLQQIPVADLVDRGRQVIFGAVADGDVGRDLSKKNGQKLLAAVRRGEASVVEALLSQGVDPEEWATNEGETSLHLACAAGSAAVVTLLLRAGCKVDVHDAGGVTPLSVAADSASLPACEALLLEGPPEVWHELWDSKPLAERVLMLVLAGCGERLAPHAADAVRELLRARRAKAGRLRQYLLTAVAYGWTGGVEVLLDCKADPSQRDPCSHRNALELSDALMRSRISSMLREKGADDNAFNPFHAEWALCVASSRSAQRSVEWWAGQCDPDWRMPPRTKDEAPWEGSTALMHGAADGHFRIVECLLQRKANPALRDGHGRTSAAYARSRGHNRLADWLEREISGWIKAATTGMSSQAAEAWVARNLAPGIWSWPSNWVMAAELESSGSEEVETGQSPAQPRGRGMVTTGRLHLDIISATGPTEQPGKPLDQIDMFVKIRSSAVSGKTLDRTKAVRGEAGQIVWNHAFEMEFDRNDRVMLYVYDDETTDGSYWRGLMGLDNEELLGVATLPTRRYARALRAGKVVETSVPVKSDEGYQIEMQVRLFQPAESGSVAPGGGHRAGVGATPKQAAQGGAAGRRVQFGRGAAPKQPQPSSVPPGSTTAAIDFLGGAQAPAAVREQEGFVDDHDSDGVFGADAGTNGDNYAVEDSARSFL